MSVETGAVLLVSHDADLGGGENTALRRGRLLPRRFHIAADDLPPTAVLTN